MKPVSCRKIVVGYPDVVLVTSGRLRFEGDSCGVSSCLMSSSVVRSDKIALWPVLRCCVARPWVEVLAATEECVPG